MATCWVPGLPNVESFSGHPKCSIWLHDLGQVQSPCLMFFELKITKNYIEVRLKGTGKELPVGVLQKNYYSAKFQ